MNGDVLIEILRIYYPALLLGSEVLLICIIMLIWVSWNKKFSKHLKENHPLFYKENFDTPFLAGGPEVMKKHYRALKVFYWGEMPDELSKVYQRKIKFYEKLTIFCMIIFLITMISTALALMNRLR